MLFALVAAVLPVLPLVVHVAEDEGEPVRDDAWIEAQLASSQRLFNKHGVRFKWTEKKALASKHAHLASNADRDALAPLVQGGVVNVFLVASLKDDHEKNRYRYGVHWRAVAANKRYICLAAGAPNTVLAHELGHWFGNGHTNEKDNVMSYIRSGAELFFDAQQVARILSIARRALDIKELFPAPE